MPALTRVGLSIPIPSINGYLILFHYCLVKTKLKNISNKNFANMSFKTV